jgi:uncharacterized protein (TIGR03000 family)
MYSVVLLMAMTSGGDAIDRGHRGGCGCGGQSYSCGCEGGRHHRRGGGCGSGCGSCGYAGGCSSCGSGYAYGGSYGACATCANGICPIGGAVVEAEAPATIVVSLPADAKLLIDDAATTSTSERRVFVSPNLPTGKEFHYTLKAEIPVNGKAQVVSQVVTVRAGEQTDVSLTAATGVAER